MEVAQIDANRSSPPSLDNTACSVQSDNFSSLAQRALFQGLEDERDSLIRVLDVYDEKPKRQKRIRECGTNAWVVFAEAERKAKIQSTSCEQRCCPRCRRRIARQTAARCALWLGEVKPKEWRFVTLTVRSTVRTLAQQLDDIALSFRNMRKTLWWKDRASYGKGFIEITYNPDQGTWHPHLHILLKGRYIDQYDLSSQWMRFSKGSPIVDIRKVSSGENAAKYITKYLGKPPASAGGILPDNLLREYLQAIDNRKMIINFGGGPALPSLADVEEAAGEPTTWINVGTLESLILRARKNDEKSRNVLLCLWDLTDESLDDLLDSLLKGPP